MSQWGDLNSFRVTHLLWMVVWACGGGERLVRLPQSCPGCRTGKWGVGRRLSGPRAGPRGRVHMGPTEIPLPGALRPLAASSVPALWTWGGAALASPGGAAPPGTSQFLGWG